MTYQPTSVEDATAHALLAEYFAYRSATFPNPAGYTTTFPTPSQFVEPEGVFLVVEDDGAAVGCGGIRSLGAGRFEVKHLWLQPATQGRGLGRALLAELERRALELGATELVLDTNASLEAAGGLYRSSGYVDIEPYNDNPNATNWYRKVLAPPVPPRRRLMFVQLKTGFDTDRGPSWICWVDFNRSWKTARFHGKELRRSPGADANFSDVETHEKYWLSGPKKDRTDLRYGPGAPTVDDDAREAYEAFLAGALLPGREQG